MSCGLSFGILGILATKVDDEVSVYDIHGLEAQDGWTIETETRGLRHGTATRITRDPAVMGGKPCIRGLRVTVGTVVGLVAVGPTRDEVLRGYPYLEAEDISEALSYAAWRAQEIEVRLGRHL
jgi:uncharacterized protein (DUF433 family)